MSPEMIKKATESLPSGWRLLTSKEKPRKGDMYLIIRYHSALELPDEVTKIYARKIEN